MLSHSQNDAAFKAEQEKINTANEMFFKQVNDFQNELNNFKEKSHEIHANIQIDLVNTEIFFNQLEKIRLLRESHFDNLIRCLVQLHKELTKSKAFIAELRNKSKCSYETSQLTKHEINVLIMKLHGLCTILPLDMSTLKWGKTQLTNCFRQEMLLKTQVARALLKSKTNTEPLAPIEKHVTIPDISLSKAVTEMNNMIVKLSKLTCRSATIEVPTPASEPENISSDLGEIKTISPLNDPLSSKPASTSTEKQIPTFDFKSASFFSDLYKPKTSTPMNVSPLPKAIPTTAEKRMPTFEFKPANIFSDLSKQKTTTPLNDSPLPKPVPTTAEKQMPTFEFKPANIFSDLSKQKTTTPLNVSPLPKPVPTTAEKRMPTFEFKPANIFSDLSKQNTTIPLNDLTLPKTVPTTVEKRMPTFEFKPANIFSDLSKQKTTTPLNDSSLPKPVPTTAEKQMPTFEFKPANIFSDLSKQKTTTPLNVSPLPKPVPTTAEKRMPTFEFKPANIFSDLSKQNTTIPLNDLTLPKTVPTTAEKRMPTFEFKPANIFSDLSKQKTTTPLNDSPLPKSVPTTAEKRMPTFEFKPANIFSDLSKQNTTIPLNDLTLPKTVPTTAEKRMPTFEFKPANIFSDLSKQKTTTPLNDSPLPKSVPTTAEKRMPTFEFKPANIFSDLSKQNTTTPLNDSPLDKPVPTTVEKRMQTFEFKPANIFSDLGKLKTTTPLNDLTLPKPVPTTAEKRMPTFEFKPANIFSDLSKQNTTIPLNDLTLPKTVPTTAEKRMPTFEFKPANIFSDLSKQKTTTPLNDSPLPKSVPTTAEKRMPTFEFKPANIFSDLSKQNTTTPLNDSPLDKPVPTTVEKRMQTFEFKPANIFSDLGKLKTTTPLNDLTLPKPVPTTAEKQMPTFEFKPANIFSDLSKQNTTTPLNDLTLPKPVPTTAEKQMPTFEFKPANIFSDLTKQKTSTPLNDSLLSKPVATTAEKQMPSFEFKAANIFSDLTKQKTSTPLNDSLLSKSVATTAKQIPTFEFKPATHSPNKPIVNFGFEKKPMFSFNTKGTNHVKYQPLVVQTGLITEKFQCITCMKEYDDKSLEELRLDDMTMASRSGLNWGGLGSLQQQRNTVFFGTPTGTARMHFIPLIGEDVDKFSKGFIKVKHQYITCMKEYEDRSFEELRLEDYMAGRKNLAPSVFGIPQKSKNRPKLRSCGTKLTRVKYEPVVETEVIVKDGSSYTILVKLQCISCMKEYAHKSLEELRLANYRNGLLGPRQTNEASSGVSNASFQQEQKQETTKPTTSMFCFGTSVNSESTAAAAKSDNAREYLNIIFRNHKGRNGSTAQDTSCQQEQNQETSKPSVSKPSFAPSANNNPTIGKANGADTGAFGNIRVRTSEQREDKGSKEQDTSFQQEQKQETSKPSVPKPSSAPSANNNPTIGKANDTATRAFDNIRFRASEQSEDNGSKEGTQSSKAPSSEIPTQKKQESEREKPTQERNTSALSAEERKEAGDRLFEQEKYEEAIKLFDAALELCPENPDYLSNRSAAFMMLRQFGNALEDIKKAVYIDPMSSSRHIRMAQCCLSLGDIVTGEQAVRRATELSGASCVRRETEAFSDLRRRLEHARKLMEKKDYHEALNPLDYCLKHYNVSCFKTKIMKAECLAMVRRYQEAQNIAINVSLFEKTDADAYYVIGLCSFYQGKEENAFEYFQKVLQQAPDHKKAQTMYKKAKIVKAEKLLKLKKEQGNEAFNNGNWQKALKLYNEALDVSVDNNNEKAKLHYNKATVYAKLNNNMKSAQACTEALALDHNYVKALLRRAQCFTELNYLDDAVKDYQHVYNLNSNQENKRSLDKANKALKQFKASNFYYKILGIKTNASPEDIKNAYRKCSLLYHPDRHRDAGQAWISIQESRFKQMGEAHDILKDKRKRDIYDRQQYDDNDDEDDDDEDDDYDDQYGFRNC